MDTSSQTEINRTGISVIKAIADLLRAGWNSWVRAGLDHPMPDDISRRIQIGNTISLIFAILSFIGIPFDYFVLGERSIAHGALVGIMFVLIPILAAAGHHRLSRWGLILTALLAHVSFIFLVGRTSGAEFLCFPFLALPLLILTSEEWLASVLFCLIGPVFFALLESGTLDPWLPIVAIGVKSPVYWYNVGVSFALLMVGLGYFRFLHESDSRRILQQQSQITQAAKSSAVGRLAGGIAHEINNPLTVILGKAESAKSALARGSNEQVHANLELISSMVDRITTIIRSLTSIARGAYREPARLACSHAVIDSALLLCRESINASGVSFEIELADEDLDIRARHMEISQILVNLIGNAFDAVRNADERWIKLQARRDGAFVVFTITDSGPGISREHQDFVFEPFFTTKRVGDGVGLGLSISLSLAHSNGGSLFLARAKGPTTFTLHVPSAR